MSDEKLIEEAAKALTGLTDAEWEIATAEGTDHLTGYFEAAARCLAVLEKAHTPTGDEREALADVRYTVHGGTTAPDGVHRVGRVAAEAILAAGFRRTVQGEPSDAEIDAAWWRAMESGNLPRPRGDGTARELFEAGYRAAAVREEGQGHGVDG